MSASVTDWSHYLASVCEEYAHWWEKYTLTDVTGKAQQAASKGGGLLLNLMAETVPEKDEGDLQKDKQADKIKRFTVLEGLRKYAKGHVLLQGAPGSGKSTAMARLLLEEAGRAKDTTEPGEGAVEQKAPKIPVLVELRYYDQSLQQLIEDSVQRRDPSLDVGKLDQWLRQGWLLLLLDGVNELPSDAARQDVRRFRLRYEKTTSMVFTTRKLGEGGDLGIGKKLTMRPLSEAQMQDFVQAYLPGQGKAMLAQLGDRLLEFGTVPLLLWMLCSVYKNNQQQIPANLGEIFQQFTQIHDQKLKQDVPDPNNSKIFWPELLQDLAFWMIKRNLQKAMSMTIIAKRDAEEIIRSFLRESGEESSLRQARLCLGDLLNHNLVKPNVKSNNIQFLHQLIQEYYAAEKLLRQLPELSDEDLKWQYLNHTKWTEPVTLMAGLVSQEDGALRLVRLALELDYELGARLAGAIAKEWQPQAVNFVSDIATSKQIRAHLLKTTNSTAAISELLIALKANDPSVRTSAVYSLVDTGNTAAISFLVHALKHDEAPSVRNNIARVLGEIGNTAAVSGLTNALEDEDSSVRSSAAEALGEIGNASAIPILLNAFQDEHPYVRMDAASSLGRIGDAAAVSGLLSALLHHEDVTLRMYVADALGKIGDSSAVSGLMGALQDISCVRSSVVDALGKIGDVGVIPELLNALDDNKMEVRRNAANALGKVGDASVVPKLLEALQDKVSDVRRNAANALGRIGDASASPKLLEALQDEVLDVCRAAAYALGKIGNSAIPGLLEALKSNTSFVRRSAADALGTIGNASAVSNLLHVLQKDKDSEVRRSAASALGTIGEASSISGLLRALQDNDSVVCRNAAYSLGKMGDAAIPFLLSALKDDHPSIRRDSADALGHIGNASAVSDLLHVLQKDKDSEVRRSAANALGTIGEASAIPGLLDALQDEDSTVLSSVANALITLDDTSALNALVETLGGQSLNTFNSFRALKQAQGKLGYYRPFPLTPMATCEVVISYAWGNESETIANQIDHAFQTQNINIIRDKKDAGYRANIRDFMQRIGQAKCVLLVISDKYLKSENCIFELMEIANNGDFYDRIFPIVLSDANIYKATARLKYIQHWEQQIADLETAMKAGGLANLQGITDDLNLYTKIRNSIASLTDTLKNMNTLTPDMHRDSNFEAVIDAVQDKLAE